MLGLRFRGVSPNGAARESKVTRGNHMDHGFLLEGPQGLCAETPHVSM